MLKKRRGKKQGQRAVIYARYSSHNQREISIEQQVECCKAYAQRHGFDIVEIYPDKAISGRTDNRPSFQRMLHDAEQDMFDVVIAWKSNRMGRNMLEAMQNDLYLSELGICCYYVEEDFEDNAAGRFALRNMQNVNQFYSEALAEDVRRGMMDNASKCMVNGKIPFGYRKSKDGKYEIVPEQAEIVREIFQRVIEGWPHIDIMDDLNARGIKNRDGNIWKRTAFDKLLRCEQYIGVYKFSDVRIDGGVPAILDKQIFEEVQHILTTKKNPRGRKRNNADYLLTGKLFCGKCGSPMVGICGTSRTGNRHYYYLCQGKHNHKCDKKNERKEQIEAEVIRIVRQIILDDKTIDWIVEGYQRFTDSMRQESAVNAMEAELAEAEKAIANLMRAIEAGIITETTKSRMMELEAQKKELQQSIRFEQAALKTLSADQIRFAIEKYRDAHLDDTEYQRDLIRTFIKAVYCYDDHYRIVISRGQEDNIDVSFATVSDVETQDSVVCIKSPLPHQKP